MCNFNASFLVEECTCDACVPPDQETMNHLSPIGILFTVTLTYTGFVMLAIGSFWNANIVKKCKKLSEECRKLREQKQKKKSYFIDEGNSTTTTIDFSMKDDGGCKDGN